MIKSAGDILAIVSLLMTILTFFLNLGWKSIDGCLNADTPPVGRTKERERQQQKIRSCSLTVVVPTLVCLLLLMYVNLPTYVSIAKDSKFSLWDFDVTETLFCFMEYALFVFILIVLNIARMLFKKYQALRV